MIEYINKKYDFKFNVRFENKYFQMGYISAHKNSPSPRISSTILQDKIKSLRNTSSIEENNHQKFF